MKKLFSIMLMALIVLSVMPLVFAEGDSADGNVDVGVTPVNDAPEIFTDPTDRSWNPNDQTYYTADLYGSQSSNAFCDMFWDVPLRGDYVFQGESLMYYVGVYDDDGEDDIDTVILQKDDGSSKMGVGSCSELDESPANPCPFPSDSFINGKFTIPTRIAYDSSGAATDNSDRWKFYRCMLVVQSSWTGDNEVNIKATDKSAHSVETTWSDFLAMNPPLNIDLTGAVSFGTVEEGSNVTSNSVSLENVGSDGVVMDMYIASADYFTDPARADAICGIGNGIPHCAFSYYATKGSMDSGSNDNSYPGLGETTATHAAPPCDPYVITCIAEEDEFTMLPSHSGEIDDMCRIINHQQDSSLLAQGQSMSLTFQLNVPKPCEGSFSSGKFHFAGRVV